MTTGKRQIPINHQGSRGARRDDPVAGRKDAPSAAAAKNPGTGRTDAAAASLQGSPNVHAASTAKTTAGSPRSRQDRAASPGANATELESLIAERDALVAEREALTTRLEALTSQVETLTDSRLRLQAEFENFRRRASREAVESFGRTQCEVLNDFLPILDNLERALDAAEHHEEGKVLTGVRMTRDMFVALLARAGVEEIEGVGAQFDPEVHDAMAVQPSEYEEGVVAVVLERGYRQGERVLRPARVVVSTGREEAERAGGRTEAAGGSGGGTASG